jgi:hypothetical protein
VERAKKYFSYLEYEYGFKVTLQRNSDVRPQTDGVVEYTSNTTVIAIHEYLNTSDKEKDLLLSINPKDQSAASALSDQKFLLNHPGWKSDGTTQNKLALRLANYANWLKEHSNLCLKGDFSQWPVFYEYKIRRARADHLRRGKDELGYVRVKDDDGNWKLIKQSIFKDKFEHIEKLKKEFSK